MTPALAAQAIEQVAPAAIDAVNNFSSNVFQTRGGRIGSGMGGVIEALWGFHTNSILRHQRIGCELAWIYGHEYNDFACVIAGADWEPATRDGELLRIEVKSMVASADESKAHFDRTVEELDESELLAVFVWDWSEISGSKMVFPMIRDYFIGCAKPIAQLRDQLHVARGGSFVEAGRCPDGCAVSYCRHVGEPLNASGIRERRTGPEATKGARVSYAANFGGMLRMLGARGDARSVVREVGASYGPQRDFLEFMARNFSRVGRYL